MSIVVAEKCLDNRRRGRLQPPGGREHSPGFSRSLTLRVFGIFEGRKLLKLNEIAIQCASTDHAVKPGLKPKSISRQSGG